MLSLGWQEGTLGEGIWVLGAERVGALGAFRPALKRAVGERPRSCSELSVSTLPPLKRRFAGQPQVQSWRLGLQSAVTLPAAHRPSHDTPKHTMHLSIITVSGVRYDHGLAHPGSPAFALSFVGDPGTQHSIFSEWVSKWSRGALSSVVDISLSFSRPRSSHLSNGDDALWLSVRVPCVHSWASGCDGN